jgi:AbiV family abortive infection protein
MPRRRVLPTPQEALEGIPLAIANAGRHLDAASVLAEAHLLGPAVSHLIYSIEEAEKARSIGQVWLNSWQPHRPDRPTDTELRDRIFDHRARHEAAANKSWASGPFWTVMAEATREHVRLSPARTPEQRVAIAHAAHPEALPADWEQSAYLLREGALYVDLRDDGWHTPDEFAAEDYESLRLKAVHYLRIVTTAFEQNKWEFRQRGGRAPITA